jgi:hypothetical protein
VWILLSPSLQGRSNHHEIKELEDRIPGFIEWRELEGAEEQAILWMQLNGRSIGGEDLRLTVVEGNANTSFRARPGWVAPPRVIRRKTLLPVNYKDAIVNEEKWIHKVTHNWASRVQVVLTQYGID